jgi:hypothetical protein
MVHAAANRMHNDIGCKGRTPFMELPNFDWETFWLPGVAHTLLLGVVKDLFQLLFRKQKDNLLYGNEYFIPNDVRVKMLSQVKKLSPTSGYPRGLTNILGCAFLSVPTGIVYCQLIVS